MVKKDSLLPPVRVDKKLLEAIEWYGHHARVSNASDRIRNILAMGLQTYKIVVNESDWQIQGILTQIDALTPEQREKVFEKLVLDMGPDADRIRVRHEKTRQEDERVLERARLEVEKQNRILDARLVFEKFSVELQCVGWMGMKFRDEDEALQVLLTCDPAKINDSGMIPPAFKKYLLERRKVVEVATLPGGQKT